MMKNNLFSIIALLLLTSKIHIFARTCDYIPNSPVIETDIPSYHHKLKLINVEAKLHRHILNEGSKPRIRVLRYSSVPFINIDSDTNIISITADDACVPSSDANAIATSPWLLTMTAAVSFFMYTKPGVSAAFMLLTMVIGSASASESCTPSMEIVIEAPPYYLGSVDECRAEVENSNHCPGDFPTFRQCSDPNPICKLAVVGAGTGGLYTAMRLVDEGKYSAKDICVFEATERVGGRLYSLRGFGPDKALVVDAGGYRTWQQFTPTTHALIVDLLGLKVDCYEDETPCQKFNIVGENGDKIGFATFVEEMMKKLSDKGTCFYPRHELSKINHVNGKNTLMFSNAVVAKDVEEVILNVPQRPLLKILRKSNIPYEGKDFEEGETYDALHSVQTQMVVKLYLYYEDAWWYKLGLKNGDFESVGDARQMLLAGRYHDGHVKCKDGRDTDCHGFLLAVYTYDFGGTKSQYFRRYQRDRPEPVTIISNTDVEGRSFLSHAHERLKEYHLVEKENKTYTGYEAQQIFDNAKEPEFAVLSTWNSATFGAGGGWHYWTDVSKAGKATKPLNSYHIHVINEAYSKLQGWAEGSLLLADDVLKEYFGVERPWNFTAPDPEYGEFVEQTSSQECAENSGNGGNSGGGTGGGTDNGAGGGGSAPDLCFTGDALVTMSDNTLQRIADIQVGDAVQTGFSDKVGRVTKVLAHKVPQDFNEYVVIATALGDLVGTLTHPIYVAGKWMEMRELSSFPEKYGFDYVSVQTRSVPMLYNLEIDGHIPGSSSHSYVVNGVIASGLGDDQQLNTMFARQKIWMGL